MIIVKAPNVRLWSNINPTYDRLDVNDVGPAIAAIIEQLRTWELLPAQHRQQKWLHPPPVSAAVPSSVAVLMSGLGLGEHEEAQRRLYALLGQLPATQHAAIVTGSVAVAKGTSDHTQELVACSLLEAVDRLDPALVGIALVEDLASSDDFSLRSCAAMLLWQKAELGPDQVPLPLLGRLARPATEDWYVHAPAMAAVKQLMLRRADARQILDSLAEDDIREQRYAVAAALLDIAAVSATAVPPDLVHRLTRDPDAAVAAKAAEVGRVIGDVTDDERRRQFGPFGL